MSGVPDVSTAGAALEQRFALDVQGLDSLRRSARASPEAALKQVSRQFEAVFMGMLLKSMREATPSSGLLEGSNSKMYLSMLDQQLAQSMAGRGLKLGDALFAQLRRSLAPAAPEVPPVPGRADAARPEAAQASPIRSPQAAPRALPPAGTPAAPPAGASGPKSPSGLQARVEAFVGNLRDAARSAAAATGIPEKLILAQAALESAWGRREVRSDDGAPTFNLFGIKADRSWRGSVAEATTTEVLDGVAQRVRARFRAYSSYQESFADYAKFLAANPRYSAVLVQGDPAKAAQALQRAGYATDPDYAAKLIRVMNRLVD